MAIKYCLNNSANKYITALSYAFSKGFEKKILNEVLNKTSSSNFLGHSERQN